MTRTFTAEQVLRSGAAPVVRGHVDGVPAVLKRQRDGAPWHDPTSAFFGGRGLVPPYVSGLLHEAAAWSRLGGDELLGVGVDAGGPWILLRAEPGAPLTRGTADARALLVAGARFLARLHAKDVLHRDLHPGNVLRDRAEYRFVDLDLALVAGLGAPGRVGKRPFRAPETGLGVEDGRADLFALARTVEWSAEAVPAELAALLRAMLDPDPAGRPCSANEVLDALGADREAPPALSPPHPGMTAWHRTRWADLVPEADPGRIVRLALAEEPDVHALGAIAGRLLARAVGTPGGWTALATLCAALWEHTREDGYREQAEEARRRAEAVVGVVLLDAPEPLHGWRPDDPAAWALGVRALLREGRAAVVAHALGEIGAAFGPRPFILASHEALQVGAAGTAATLARLGTSLFPDEAPLHVLHASALLLAGDLVPARAAIDALVGAHPGEAHAWLLRAVMDRAEGGDAARSIATAAALGGAAPEIIGAVAEALEPARRTATPHPPTG